MMVTSKMTAFKVENMLQKSIKVMDSVVALKIEALIKCVLDNDTKYIAVLRLKKFFANVGTSIFFE